MWMSLFPVFQHCRILARLKQSCLKYPLNYVKRTDISLPDDPNGPFVLVPCNLKYRNLNVTFDFGGWHGPKISVPSHESVRRHRHKHALGHHRKHQCVFEIVSWDCDAAILENTFLRSTYLVYDLENKRNSHGTIEKHGYFEYPTRSLRHCSWPVNRAWTVTDTDDYASGQHNHAYDFLFLG